MRRFPRTSVVWPGTILASVVNATMTAAYPEYAPFHGWTTKTYWVQGGDGRYGAITFGDPSLVGVFFSAASDRNPFQRPEIYTIDPFFRGCPRFQRELAEQGALRCWRHEGFSGPCITTAFWDEGEYLAAADPWDDVLEHGADLVHIQLMEDVAQALMEWANDYDMSPSQVELSRSIFLQRMSSWGRELGSSGKCAFWS